MISEKAAICQSLENLLSYPWIHSLLEAGTINVFGWYFDFETGDLLSYRDKNGEFEPVAKNLSLPNVFKPE